MLPRPRVGAREQILPIENPQFSLNGEVANTSMAFDEEGPIRATTRDEIGDHPRPEERCDQEKNHRNRKRPWREDVRPSQETGSRETKQEDAGKKSRQVAAHAPHQDPRAVFGHDSVLLCCDLTAIIAMITPRHSKRLYTYIILRKVLFVNMDNLSRFIGFSSVRDSFCAILPLQCCYWGSPILLLPVRDLRHHLL